MEKFSKHREWRGPGDTLFDYVSWLDLWVHILAALPKAPKRTRAFFLRLPADLDSQLMGLYAFPFRCSRRLLNATWKRRLIALRRGKAIFLDPSVPPELMAGFPKRTAIPLRVPGLSLACSLPPDSVGLLDCIRWIEVRTSEAFDWDAFFSHNRQLASFLRVLKNNCDGVRISPVVDTCSPKGALESIARSMAYRFPETREMPKRDANKTLVL